MIEAYSIAAMATKGARHADLQLSQQRPAVGSEKGTCHELKPGGDCRSSQGHCHTRRVGFSHCTEHSVKIRASIAPLPYTILLSMGAILTLTLTTASDVARRKLLDRLFSQSLAFSCFNHV